jgi:hypothetical protein
MALKLKTLPLPVIRNLVRFPFCLPHSLPGHLDASQRIRNDLFIWVSTLKIICLHGFISIVVCSFDGGIQCVIELILGVAASGADMLPTITL